MNRRTIGVCIVLLILPAMLLAQQKSAQKVTRITISPTSVAAGASVAISVTLQNTSTVTSGCSGSLAVFVYNAEPYSATGEVWRATQPVGPLAPGETRAVPISARWVVPAGDAAIYHILAFGPPCGSDEFGQSAVLKLRKTCTYTSLPTLPGPKIRP